MKGMGSGVFFRKQRLPTPFYRHSSKIRTRVFERSPCRRYAHISTCVTRESNRPCGRRWRIRCMRFGTWRRRTSESNAPAAGRLQKIMAAGCDRPKSDLVGRSSSSFPLINKSYFHFHPTKRIGRGYERRNGDAASFRWGRNGRGLIFEISRRLARACLQISLCRVSSKT